MLVWVWEIYANYGFLDYDPFVQKDGWAFRHMMIPLAIRRTTAWTLPLLLVRKKNFGKRAEFLQILQLTKISSPNHVSP